VSAVLMGPGDACAARRRHAKRIVACAIPVM
jgi:hypothetical protein